MQSRRATPPARPPRAGHAPPDYPQFWDFENVVIPNKRESRALATLTGNRQTPADRPRADDGHATGPGNPRRGSSAVGQTQTVLSQQPAVTAFKTTTEFVGLRLEFHNVGLLEAREILELPLNRGQFGQMATTHHFPRGSTGNKSEQESLVLGR